MRARMSKSFQNSCFRNDSNMQTFRTIGFQQQVFKISSRALLRIHQGAIFLLHSEGSHAGRSRAHVELLLCANPDQRIQRGPRVRVFVCRNPCKTFIFRSESNIKKKHCETDGFSKQASRSDLARSCGFIWGVQCIFNIIDQEGHAGRSRARMSNLSVARIPVKQYHAGHMRARTSKSLQSLRFRSESNVTALKAQQLFNEILHFFIARALADA